MLFPFIQPSHFFHILPLSQVRQLCKTNSLNTKFDFKTHPHCNNIHSITADCGFFFFSRCPKFNFAILNQLRFLPPPPPPPRHETLPPPVRKSMFTFIRCAIRPSRQNALFMLVCNECLCLSVCLHNQTLSSFWPNNKNNNNNTRNHIGSNTQHRHFSTPPRQPTKKKIQSSSLNVCSMAIISTTTRSSPNQPNNRPTAATQFGDDACVVASVPMFLFCWIRSSRHKQTHTHTALSSIINVCVCVCVCVCMECMRVSVCLSVCIVTPCLSSPNLISVSFIVLISDDDCQASSGIIATPQLNCQ